MKKIDLGLKTELDLNIALTQNEIYADVVIISHNPLPCIIFYIQFYIFNIFFVLYIYV